MGYHARVFCTSEDVPTLGELLGWLWSIELQVKVMDEDMDFDLGSRNWHQACLVYKKDRLPILVDCNRDDGTSACLFREEINTLLESIGPPGNSKSRNRVVDHLNNSRFIIVCQLSDDINDEGYDATDWIIHYFIENCGGMAQADGEGFFAGTELILKEKKTSTTFIPLFDEK